MVYHGVTHSDIGSRCHSTDHSVFGDVVEEVGTRREKAVEEGVVEGIEGVSMVGEVELDVDYGT